MKKKVLSFSLMIIMCLTIVLPASAYAAENETPDIVTTNEEMWAIPDLMNGYTYEIFSHDWIEQDLTKPIGQAKLRVLLAGLRGKILDTECAKEARQVKVKLSNPVTVTEAISAFYTVLSNYDYTNDIGLSNFTNPVEYMQEYNIYSENNGGQLLDDECSFEQALVIATRIITVIYEELEASSKGFFWEIESGENKVYLLGSIHAAASSIYPISQTIWQAYESSDALILEADLGDQDAIDVMGEMMIYTDGTNLKDHISEETYQSTIEIASFIGLSEEIVTYLKPWYLYLLLDNIVAVGFEDDKQVSANLGIDMTFYDNAIINQKPIFEIEGLIYQMQMLDSFSKGLQEMLLYNNIVAVYTALNGSSNDNVIDNNEVFNLMLDYWHDGDVEAFESLYASEDNYNEADEVDPIIQEYLDEYQDKFFTQRDRHMAEYIDALLKTENDGGIYFVVVGSAHYISEYSVLDILDEMGYEINKIN